MTISHAAFGVCKGGPFYSRDGARVLYPPGRLWLVDTPVGFTVAIAVDKGGIIPIAGPFRWQVHVLLPG